MKLKPRDLKMLERLKHQAERHLIDLDTPEHVEVFEALKSATAEKSGELVSVQIPKTIASRMAAMSGDGTVSLSYGIRVIYTVGAGYRNLSMSRKGEPKVPRAVQVQILSIMGFDPNTDLGKMGRALHAVEPFDLPIDA